MAFANGKAVENKERSTKRTVMSLAQWALGLGALAWALSDVNLVLLARSVAGWSLVSMLPVFAFAFVDYVCMGFRLWALMPKGTSWALCMKANLLCVGMNCILPAKAGDALKILYLARNANLGFATTSSIAIWERLCDVIFLSCLLLFALTNLDSGKLGMSVTMPLLILGAGVMGFFALRHWSGFFHALYARFLPARLASPLSSLHASLVDRVSVLWVARGLAWSCGTWGTYFLSFVFALRMGGINIPLPAMMTVFAISCLGTAIPSLPGGIGLFEGVMVLALSWFDVDATRGLGVALFFHAVHFLPLALIAIVLNGKARYWAPNGKGVAKGSQDTAGGSAPAKGDLAK